MIEGQRLQGVGYQRGGGGGEGDQAHPPGSQLGQSGEFLVRHVQVGRNLVRPHQQPLSGLGQRDAPGPAQRQRKPGFSLE